MPAGLRPGRRQANFRVMRLAARRVLAVRLERPCCLAYFFFATGVTAYGLAPRALETASIVFCALTLLPAASSGGAMTAIPNLPGATAMMPPPTPLLAGSPVL